MVLVARQDFFIFFAMQHNEAQNSKTPQFSTANILAAFQRAQADISVYHAENSIKLKKDIVRTPEAFKFLSNVNMSHTTHLEIYFYYLGY